MAFSRSNTFSNLLKLHEIEPVSNLPSNLICMLCKKMLMNARQTPCGCRYCSDCITEEFRKGLKKCPGKTEDCIDDTLNLEKDIIFDNNANREVGKLLMKCPYYGCPSQHELRKLSDHMLICDYKVEMCDKCKKMIKKMDLDRHRSDMCEWRQVACRFCKVKFSNNQLETVHYNIQHQNICDQYRAECPNMCGIGTTVLIKQHLPICSNKPQLCPFVTIGCPLTNVPRQQMTEHLTIEGQNHAKSLVSYIDNLHNEITSLKNDNIAQAECIKNLKKEAQLREALFERRHNDFVWKVDGYSRLLASAQKGKTLFIESKSFLSDRYGYKVKLKLFANGDGERGVGYISVYFIFLHGKYDDLLVWPFSGTVSLTLMNCEGRNDFVKTGEFKDLSRESHVGAGCVKFFEIAQLAQEGFLKNDNIYIKCAIG